MHKEPTTILDEPKHSSLAIFLRGLAMGSVDIVPGISGGTIAFITGIYPRLVQSINQVREESINILKQPKQFTKAIKRIDLVFILPLLIGILLAIFLVSGIMGHILTNYPTRTFAFFAGLILASTYLMTKTLEKINQNNILSLVVGVIVAYFISGATSANIPTTLPIIFVSGAIAICAMLLPGISGAFILVLLGQYQTIVTAIHERSVLILVTFGAGIILGLAIFGKLVHKLLENYRNVTLYVLTGVMLGALRVPYLEITNNGGFQNPIYLIYFLILGVVIVYGINLLAWVLNRNRK